MSVELRCGFDGLFGNGLNGYFHLFSDSLVEGIRTQLGLEFLKFGLVAVILSNSNIVMGGGSDGEESSVDDRNNILEHGVFREGRRLGLSDQHLLVLFEGF